MTGSTHVFELGNSTKYLDICQNQEKAFFHFPDFSPNTFPKNIVITLEQKVREANLSKVPRTRPE